MKNKNQRKKWQDEILKPALEKFPERKSNFATGSGIPLPRVALPEEGPSYQERLGLPGEKPFTRGVYPTMHRGRLWTMRQYAGFASAEESNQRYRYLLEQGQTGLSVAFDLPTQIGYDSDHPLSAGEVGRVGVPISSLSDMETLLDGIPLESVSISMTINSTAFVLLAMLIAVANKRGVPREALRGTLQNDILKEYIARGTYRYPPQPSMRLVVDTIEYCTLHMPKWNPISISGYHIREAGATAIQELAFTLADALAYVDAAVARGLDVDAFAPRLSFFFNAHNDLLEEVAKFRAARRLWARLIKTRFGATNPKSMALRFHAQTAGSTLTSQQPDNNIARVTVQALAAVLGGCQSLHTNARDEAIGLPTEHAATVALRTQQILAHESGVTNTVDPFAGSYVVEHLTDHLESAALELIAKIDDAGGMLEAVSAGYPQSQIHAAAYRAQQAIESGETTIVGVNSYVEEDEQLPAELLTIDPSVERSRRDQLACLRRNRNNAEVEARLSQLQSCATQGTNVIDAVVGCVEASATLGEVSATLASVFGEHEDSEHY